MKQNLFDFEYAKMVQKPRSIFTLFVIGSLPTFEISPVFTESFRADRLSTRFTTIKSNKIYYGDRKCKFAITNDNLQWLLLKMDDHNDEATESPKPWKGISLQQSIDEFLDTPFFNPEQILLDDEQGNNIRPNPITKWFAKLTVTDYITAESLFAAAFITIMVVISQELFRIQLYGDDYVPFLPGGRSVSSRLF